MGVQGAEGGGVRGGSLGSCGGPGRAGPGRGCGRLSRPRPSPAPPESPGPPGGPRPGSELPRVPPSARPVSARAQEGLAADVRLLQPHGRPPPAGGRGRRKSWGTREARRGGDPSDSCGRAGIFSLNQADRPPEKSSQTLRSGTGPGGVEGVLSSPLQPCKKAPPVRAASPRPRYLLRTADLSPPRVAVGKEVTPVGGPGCTRTRCYALLGLVVQPL